MADVAIGEKTGAVGYKSLVRIVIGAVIGAGFGFGVSWIGVRLHVSLKSLTWSDLLAGWLGVTYFGVGVLMYAVSFSRRELARNLAGEDTELPATNDEVHATRLQAATAGLAGLMLLLPILATGSVAGMKHGGAIVFSAILVLFVLQTAANVMVWRVADEFLRQLVLVAHAVTSAVGTAALFLWAAAEHLHLVRPATSWDILALAMTLYLLTGSYLQIRAFTRQ